MSRLGSFTVVGHRWGFFYGNGPLQGLVDFHTRGLNAVLDSEKLCATFAGFQYQLIWAESLGPFGYISIFEFIGGAN